MRLDALVRSTLAQDRKDDDPVGLVHDFDDAADIEVAGLVAAFLAFGNITVIRRNVALVLERLGRPSEGVHRSLRSLSASLRGFRHRVYRGTDVARLLHNAGRLIAEHGSLDAAMGAFSGEVPERLTRFAAALRGDSPTRGLAHLVASPNKGSACKRMWLYLRWMVRPDDGVDFGLWKSLAPSELLIPVDTHVLRIAQNLGLTTRNDASWKTAEAITASLRQLDPLDPVRYDFALCHLGVSQQCPSARVATACSQCSLKPACVHWNSTDSIIHK